MPIAKRIGWCIVLAAQSALVGAQSPVPLGDPVSEPLLPAWISRQDVSIDGQLAYLWQNALGEHVIHVVGDFELTSGGRVLRARQGIIWMSGQRAENRDYRAFDVFLFRDAYVAESGGTISEGPVLFATLNSTGEVFLSSDRRAFASSGDTAVYRDAAAVRMRIREGTIGTGDPEPPTPLQFPAEPVEEPVPPELYFSAKETSFSTLEDGGQIITCIGGVTVFRGDAGDGNVLELQADSAVIFLQAEREKGDQAAPTLRLGAGQPGILEDAGVEGVYLEGDLRMSYGDRRVRASRLYYDLVRDRALILDAVVFTMLGERNIPFYIRASEIRQLSRTSFAAKHALITTSEFHTPHYHIGAEHLELVDRTSRSPAGERTGVPRLDYRMRNTSFSLYNIPLLFWPVSAGSAGFGDLALRGLSVGASDDFGVSVETDWDLFNLLSLEGPEDSTAELRLEYFEKRGPAVGLDVDYRRDDYFGLYRGYFIDDRGQDNLGRFRDNDPDTDTRGRTTWRHRHYLPDDWELTFEVSYISDRAFLEEYFEREFDEGKEQESLIYLVKRGENWAFTALAQWRLNEFYTQTERMPDFSLRVIGEPVGDPLRGGDSLRGGDFGTWFSENRAGLVRYRAAEKEFFLLLRQGSDGPSSGATARADSRQEIEFPVNLGPVRLVPFLAVRGTAWDDSPEGGGLTRGFATYGVRSSMYLSRVFPDIRNELLDINGVRHVIKPQLVAWGSHSSREPDEMFPFDNGVEGIDDFDSVAVGVRQRWQTRRGVPPAASQPVRLSHWRTSRQWHPAPGRERTVDWIMLDVELGLFNDARGTDVTNGFVSFSRPENSVARNYINTDFVWRVNDSTALLSEMNYDVNDGEVDTFNVSLAVDRTPRFSYLLGYRFIEESESNLLGFGMNYRVDRKHTLAFREQFDLERGDTLDFSVAYIRKFPRWFVAITFELDEAEDNAGVSLSVWPEGLPRATLGSRRFSALSTSTAMRPN